VLNRFKDGSRAVVVSMTLPGWLGARRPDPRPRRYDQRSVGALTADRVSRALPQRCSAHSSMLARRTPGLWCTIPGPVRPDPGNKDSRAVNEFQWRISTPLQRWSATLASRNVSSEHERTQQPGAVRVEAHQHQERRDKVTVTVNPLVTAGGEAGTWDHCCPTAGNSVGDGDRVPRWRVGSPDDHG